MNFRAGVFLASGEFKHSLLPLMKEVVVLTVLGEMLSALAMACTWRSLRSITWYFMAKPWLGSTAPSFGTRSRTWP